jgi:hypothetical protein
VANTAACAAATGGRRRREIAYWIVLARSREQVAAGPLPEVLGTRIKPNIALDRA